VELVHDLDHLVHGLRRLVDHVLVVVEGDRLGGERKPVDGAVELDRVSGRAGVLVEVDVDVVGRVVEELGVLANGEAADPVVRPDPRMRTVAGRDRGLELLVEVATGGLPAQFVSRFLLVGGDRRLHVLVFGVREVGPQRRTGDPVVGTARKGCDRCRSSHRLE